MFENIFNMVINIKGKIKDNIKARIYIVLICHRKNIELVYIGSQITKPEASIALDKNT